MARRSQTAPIPQIPIAVITTRSSATDRVYDAIRAAILARTLPSGTPLVEASLAQQFGVSKTPVREALQRLAHSGLVDFEPVRGVTVHTLTSDEIRDIAEMRMYLEPLGLRQSTSALTPADFKAMDDMLSAAQGAMDENDLQALSTSNGNFHRALYAHAHNKLLVQWLDGLGDKRRLLSLQGWAQNYQAEREWHEHATILDALKQGNTDQACAALRAHIAAFANLLLAQLDPSAPLIVEEG
jgi:DNA-binding GntR family transcriptional regulator